MSSDRQHGKDDEDVLEMRKAIATGSAKEGPAVSSGEYEDGGLCAARSNSRVFGSVAPIVCYCLASILMTVVNKVCQGSGRL